MKNENTTTEAERIAKAFNQLANAIGNLCKAVRKTEQKDFATMGTIPKTHPFYGMPMVDWLAGMHENEIIKNFFDKGNNFGLDDKFNERDNASKHDQRIKEWVEAIEIWKNNLINKNSQTKTEPNDPLAGMYVGEKKYPDYVCIKDFGQMKVGDIIKYQYIENYNKYVYAFIDKKNMIINTTKEGLEKNTEFFKKVETKATTIYHDFICSKDYFFINGVVKKGTILKKFKGDYEPDRITSFYFFIDDKGTENLFPLSFLETNSEFFKIVYSFPFVTDKEIKINANKTINEQQTKFDLLKENQIIEFTLKNGKTYKAQVLKDSTTKMYYLNSMCGNNAIYFHDLNQFKYKNNLNLLYGNNDVYPSAPNLECLTNDLNTLIQLPDLSCKQPETSKYKSYVTQANELIENFMPLVTGWVANGPPPLVEVNNIVWSLSDSNKRKAAIKVAIKHCDLFQIKLDVKNRQVNEMQIIKEQLQKMLSE